MVKGDQAESGGGGCGDCMLKGSGGGLWGFLRGAEVPLRRIAEAAVPVRECLLLVPFFQIYTHQ